MENLQDVIENQRKLEEKLNKVISYIELTEDYRHALKFGGKTEASREELERQYLLRLKDLGFKANIYKEDKYKTD